MSRRGEAGFALILVLILVAVGSLVLIPTIQLSTTAVKSSNIAQAKTRAMYAIDGGHELVVWQMLYGTLAETASFTLDACGVEVSVDVQRRAVPGEGGVALIDNTARIRPLKSVEPSVVPDLGNGIPADYVGPYTYTINLEQLVDDNLEELEAIYDVLPAVARADRLTIDNVWVHADGQDWPAPLPAIDDEQGQQVRIVWPTTYNLSDGSGGFSDVNGAEYALWEAIGDEGFGHFDVREAKELRFDVTFYDGLSGQNTWCNWTVLRPWGTTSGPQAEIYVDGSGEECKQGGGFTVTKAADPAVLMPGVGTDITYEISITNHEDQPLDLGQVFDYLPPEFVYGGPVAGGTLIVVDPPVVDPAFDPGDGKLRTQVIWDIPASDKQFAAGETKNFFFIAWAPPQEVSGNFYNEVFITEGTGTGAMPQLFFGIINDTQYFGGYSWTDGKVMVPSYDSEASADGMTIDANLIYFGGVWITSYQVR